MATVNRASAEPLVFTMDEVVKKLAGRISRGSLYKAARAGEIPVIKIGRRLLVPARALETFLNGGIEVQA